MGPGRFWCPVSCHSLGRIAWAGRIPFGTRRAKCRTSTTAMHPARGLSGWVLLWDVGERMGWRKVGGLGLFRYAGAENHQAYCSGARTRTLGFSGSVIVHDHPWRCRRGSASDHSGVGKETLEAHTGQDERQAVKNVRNLSRLESCEPVQSRLKFPTPSVWLVR